MDNQSQSFFIHPQVAVCSTFFAKMFSVILGSYYHTDSWPGIVLLVSLVLISNLQNKWGGLSRLTAETDLQLVEFVYRRDLDPAAPFPMAAEQTLSVSICIYLYQDMLG